MEAAAEPVSTYYGLLRRIHELRRPSLYVEIGVHEGHSLAFVQPGTRIVGVDPDPKVDDPPADCTIVARTSDALFADPVALGGEPIDLGFADAAAIECNGDNNASEPVSPSCVAG